MCRLAHIQPALLHLYPCLHTRQSLFGQHTNCFNHVFCKLFSRTFLFPSDISSKSGLIDGCLVRAGWFGLNLVLYQSICRWKNRLQDHHSGISNDSPKLVGSSTKFCRSGLSARLCKTFFCYIIPNICSSRFIGSTTARRKLNFLRQGLGLSADSAVSTGGVDSSVTGVSFEELLSVTTFASSIQYLPWSFWSSRNFQRA